MTDQERADVLERLIGQRAADMLLLQLCADLLRSMTRDASKNMAELIAMRSPETVARMEAERGLA